MDHRNINFEELDMRKRGVDASTKNSILKNSGGSCDLFKGEMKNANGTVLAIALKRIRSSLTRNDRFAKLFAEEMLCWSNLDHVNIVRLEGYIEENGYPSVVYKWAEGGPVNEYVISKPGCDLVDIAKGIAKGLAYLHGCSIIHSDLKTNNVLVSGDGVPMLIDFGQARSSYYAQMDMEITSQTNNDNTSRWLAIETFDFLDNEPEGAEGQCTTQSDMWSFGMVIYAILAGEVPYADYTGPLAEFKIIRAIRDKKLPSKPQLKSNAAENLWKICTACWKPSPKDRIGIDEVLERLSVP